ncbi:MAG TPA: succinylglutamate desuccinylase/aspartoacylase family protein, partial [Dongiaceae bacterium]
MNRWKFDLVPAPPAGGKIQGHVAWDDPVLAGWDWPYVAVNGALPGPAVLVTAGIHGSEYPSIDAAIRLGAALDPQQMRGQILCLPVMNPSAFWERAPYVSPVDNLNLNRVFPGKAKGSFSERVAHHLTQRAIRHADAYIDMHGGDLPEALVPFAIYHESGDAKLDAKSAAMAQAFGSPSLLIQRGADAPVSGLAYATAAGFGIPAILVEDGGAGQYDAGIAQGLLAGVENVLRSLEVLPGAVRNMPPARRFAKFTWVRTKEAGFFRHEVKVGDEVAAGQ